MDCEKGRKVVEESPSSVTGRRNRSFFRLMAAEINGESSSSALSLATDQLGAGPIKIDRNVELAQNHGHVLTIRVESCN